MSTDLTTLQQNRGKILALEAVLNDLPDFQVVCETRHYFAEGVYVREYIMPKDILVVGKIHKKSQVFIVLKGEVSIYTESGEAMRYKAPCIFESPAGVKRAVYSHEDSLLVTAHPREGDTKDLGEIEEQVIAKSFEEFDQLTAATQLRLELEGATQ